MIDYLLIIINWLCLVHLSQTEEEANEIEADGDIKEFPLQEKR